MPKPMEEHEIFTACGRGGRRHMMQISDSRITQVVVGMDVGASESATKLAVERGAATESDRTLAATRNAEVLYGQTVLPAGIRSRLVDNNNGCTMHVLEAGFESRDRSCIVLLHGFPELAFSWRKQMLFLAEAGFHVIAPDQRGYGRSSGTAITFDDDLLPYTLMNHVSDTLGLVQALGCRSVAAVVGHDYGSPVAAWCALVRPDVFRSVVLMSAPFGGAPTLPVNTAEASAQKPPASVPSIHAELAALPRPRKHYRWYYSTRQANDNIWHSPQGVHDFLRAYYHFKSGDWRDNRPFPLKSWTADELANMPTYYIMDLAKDVIHVHLPPLRARQEDIPLLAQHFLTRFSRELERPVGGLAPETLESLCAHTWPGNVRELENTIKQALMTCRGYLIMVEDLRLVERPTVRVQEVTQRDPLDEGMEQMLLTHAGRAYHRVEERLIRKALELTKYNQVRAAHLLGITRNVLRHRMKQFGLL